MNTIFPNLTKTVLLGLGLLSTGPALAGSIFLTGHDPDFHATLGGNSLGAQHINQAAISYITDPTYNVYNANGISKFLFVESSISPPSGHTDGVNGIVASGYAAGTNFDRVDASGLNAALNNLGSQYDAIVIGSDFGGILTQSELDILNARSSDIIAFLNSGGGLYAMAEHNSGAGLTPNGGWYGYLPFIVTSSQLNQSESGFTVTAYGASLGLTNNDVNGNASHNIFTSTGGMNIVDQDANGNILSLATRSQINTHGVVSEPSSLALLAFSGMIGFWVRRNQQKTAALTL